MTVEELINHLSNQPPTYEVEILLRHEPEAWDLEASIERVDRDVMDKKVWLKA